MIRKPARSFVGDVSVNTIFSLLPILVTLISVPLYIAQIGLERYGIMTLVWSLTGMFAFFDFGMGAATTYLVARARSGFDGPSSGTVILTTSLVNLALGCLLALAFWLLIGPLAFGNIKSDSSLSIEIDEALIWIALLLPVGLVTSIFRNALDGERWFLLVNLIGTSGQIATVLGALVVGYIVGPEIGNLVVAVLVVRFSVLWLYVLACRDSFRSTRLMNREEFREIVHFGGWQTVFSSLSGLLGSADRFVIGWLTGASAMALYAIPFSFTARLRFLPEAFMRTLYPKLSEVKTDEARRDLAVRAMTGLLVSLSLIIVPAILSVRPFFAIWLGADFAISAGFIAQFLLIAVYVQSCLRAFFVLQRASGRPDLPAKLRMFTLIPGIGLLVLLVWLFGAIGAAASLLIRFMFELLFVFRLIRLPVQNFALLIGYLAMCCCAVIVSNTGYGIFTAAILSACSAITLCFLALYFSKDVAGLIYRLAPLHWLKGRI